MSPKTLTGEELVLDDGAWRADSFTVPGDSFGAASAYLVTFTSLVQGSADPSTGETILVAFDLASGASDVAAAPAVAATSAPAAP